VALAQTFENKAGHYQLSHLEGETAHYIFTNHQGNRAEATMTVTCWRRLQERAQAPGAPAPSPVVLGCLLLGLMLALAPPCSAEQASATAKAAGAPEDPPTRSITLPGSQGAPAQPEPGRPQPSAPQTGTAVVKAASAIYTASLGLAASSGDLAAEPHYKTAVLALKAEDLAVAATEMNEAAQLAPENGLVLYGLAVIQGRNQQPELALPNIEKASRVGLPASESARVPELLAAIRYEMRKNEAEQKKVTPIKLWGTYDTALDDPVQEFEDKTGKTIFKTRTPVSREMSLWKVDGEQNVRGHWMEKETLTEEIIYADSKRKDPKPKSITREHWWLVTILINADGSLDGSRMKTCTREPGQGCEVNNPDRGKVVTFNGHVEPNGDLTITQNERSLTLRKKSRVASTPPAEVHIQLD
jgi:hypothetical protein